MFLLATLLVLMLVRMLFPIFPAVPVGIHKHIQQYGKRQYGKDDHHWPVLPGLAQELEAVMDHDADTIHGAAANPNRRISISASLANVIDSLGEFPDIFRTASGSAPGPARWHSRMA